MRPEPNRPARRRSHGKPGTDRTLPRAILTAAEPQLFVADIKASCDFFTQKLGFALAFVYGDPPFYGQVKRDAAAFNLRCVDRPIIDAELREREHLLSAAVTVATSAEIEQLYAEFQGAGVAPLGRSPLRPICSHSRPGHRPPQAHGTPASCGMCCRPSATRGC